MKEMTECKNICQGGSVKKTLFIVALAAMLVLAFAGSAFAVDHSGNLREGPAVSAVATVGGVSVAGAGTFTYQNWNTALGTNNLSNSPHGAFTTTTVKCAVCHAVHYAAPSNGPVASITTALNPVGASGDTLLRMNANQACGYCHAATGNSVNGRPVYDGNWAAVLAKSGGSSNTGHAIGSNCDECHASVHGSNQDVSIPSLVGYLLKSQTATLTGGVSTATNVLGSIQAINAANPTFTDGAVTGYTVAQWTDPASTGSAYREQAVGIFCAECHNGAYATAEPGAITNVNAESNTTTNISSRGPGIAPDGLFTGHRVMAPATTTWNADGSKSTGSKTIGQVAYASASNCKSCHDATDTFGNAAFPHSWGQTKMWLTTASFAGAPDAGTKLLYGTAANSGYSGTLRPQLSDGVCLKCHRGSAATGVGLTF